MVTNPERLRLAILVGSLVQGGAEKQFLYLARALINTDIDVHIFTLTQNEFYGPSLAEIEYPITWIGKWSNPFLRLLYFGWEILKLKPHIIHSTHFFTNLYVALAARFFGSLSTGSLRNDALIEVRENGIWGRWLLKLPHGIIANSCAGKENAIVFGRKTGIWILPNVIDLSEFDSLRSSRFSNPFLARNDEIRVAVISRLVRAKRIDRFLEALWIARKEVKNLVGVIVGSGPEQRDIEAKAMKYGLIPEGLILLGRRSDVPQLLGKVDMLCLTSDHEGFPNVLVEAMAASLPVISTPAGDAREIIQDGVNGFVVPFEDIDGLAERMIRLANSSALRLRLGKAGRSRVEQFYQIDKLTERLQLIYQELAELNHRSRLSNLLKIEN